MIWLYTLGSVFIVSAISLVGVASFLFKKDKLETVLLYFVSFSAGALLGDAFFHLIPEIYKISDNALTNSLFILIGILGFFILEKFIHWRHCHHLASVSHPHPFSYVVLVGDAVHNFIDGLIIGASYLVSPALGIATTLAVVFHEIPHEIGNFSSLLYGGLSRGKAIFYNFLSAVFSILGAILVLSLSFDAEKMTAFLLPFAAGGFIYIATADLMPELHKSTEVSKTVKQVICLVAGIALMSLLIILE